MTGADGTYDYKAMAAGIVLAGGEGMGNLLPVVEKELLHYRILDAMMREGFFSSLVFQGGTSLRLCHGSPRYSEDLDDAVRHSRHSIVGRCGSRIPYFRCVERLQSNPLNAKEVCDVESGL